MILKLWCMCLIVICLGQMNLAADLTTTTCTVGGHECTVANSECDNANAGAKCKCSAGYKLSTAKDSCQKVLGGVCTNVADCTTPDPNANCTGSQSKTCTCKPNYEEKNNVCTLKSTAVSVGVSMGALLVCLLAGLEKVF